LHFSNLVKRPALKPRYENYIGIHYLDNRK
jgi:hypothetical protein